MNKLAQILCLAILVALAGTTGCKDREPGIEIPFETMERRSLTGAEESYEGEEAKLTIIAGPEDIDLLGSTISPDAQAQLRNLDFDRHVAIVAFQGRRPYIYTPSGVEIQKIGQRGGTITIFAQFYEYIEGNVRGMMTSPYHLVEIQKGENIHGEFKFVLKVDGKSVARQTHFIP